VESLVCIYCKKPKFWVPFHHLNVLWSFKKNQNQNYEVDVQVVQGMKCVICYNDPLLPKSLLEVVICTHSICDYMQLFVIYNFVLSFLQLIGILQNL